MAKDNVNSNALYNTIKSVFGVIYPLITFPYISRVLMTENVGKLSIGNSVVSYVSLIASLGITTYAIRECSKVKDNKEQLSVIASQIYSINILSTLVAYIALAIVLIFAKPLHNYRQLICIQSTTVLFTTLGADWLNTAMEDFKFMSIRVILMQLLSLLLMFIFIKRPEDYIKYAAISVFASSGASIVNYFYRKRFCTTRFILKTNLKTHLPKILLLFSLILSQTIYVNSDMTILGLVRGDYEAGLYSTSVKIYQIVLTTISSITWVVMPKLSYFFSKKDYSEINNTLKYALNFIVVLGIPSICGLEIIAPHIIVTIAGKEYIGATLSLRILCVSLMFSFFGGWIGNMTLLPAGRERLCLYSSIASAAINIILNFILIPLWGLNAAAFTTAVSELVGILIKFPFMDKQIRILGIKKILIGPVLGGIGILLFGYLFGQIMNVSWQISIITIIVSIVWYILILRITNNEFFMGFVSSIKHRIIKKA